ncbi:MAG: response regulator [Candidatus Neomarinimicrobiota bacterium]|nr:response regulator [Candidatus Neomarinimicrobiota bacterium]MCD6100904.1 response regulator [Candidatus Neomarinimicrobiota bacterium]RKY47569.1 MAG: response regulator [Candidatus Neomarinimicrobiota bacterium]RKY49600.1 MAG: response regulator [Candidatus Neomarinimicrobiota bacterium]RKY53988.1 MAG: response regulator [Candidatus Neomarinimicrobiota bacterium]
MLGFKVLIVDDEKNVCEFLVEFLKFKGFEADVANTGEEAIKKIREEKYDLVLLDLVMPGINGIDVLKFLNDNKINIPVIMVSGVRDEKVIKNTIELGAKDYIPKPIDLEKLENSIFFHVRKNQFGSGNRCQQ